MKLASFAVDDRSTWGLVEGDSVRDLGADFAGRLPDLRTAIAANAWSEFRDAAKRAPSYDLDRIAWLPVITNPGKIICIGLNYEEHRKETGRSDSEFPTVFARFANSQTGHLSNVPLSPLSSELDYEGELALIIGKGGRYIPENEAHDYVAGYACYNDITARDWQRHTHQFTPGKNFPRTGAFGPWMVTPSAMADFGTTRLQTRVNGVVVQSALLAQMIFSVARLIEYCSRFTRLEPGDVIVTGTPGGVGAKRQPPLWLRPGDVTEVEIDGVGLLRNTIVAE